MIGIKNNRGFSLVELIVVIAIMGIMSALVIPKMGSSSYEAKLKAAAREVVTNSRYARDQAITTSKDYKLTFKKDATQYTIEKVEPTPEVTTIFLPEGVKISSPDYSVTYKPIGTTGDPCTIILSSGSSSKNIKFSTSLIRIE